MLPTKKTKLSLLIDAVLLLGSIAIFVGAILYISNLRYKIRDREFELESEKLFSSGLQSTKSILNSSRDQLQQLDSFFIQDEQTIEYLNDIETIANNNNVAINLDLSSAIEPLENEIARLGTFDIRLNVSGDFNNVMNFLRQVALKDENIEISDLALNKSVAERVGENQPAAEINQPAVLEQTWNMSLTLTLYQELS